MLMNRADHDGKQHEHGQSGGAPHHDVELSYAESAIAPGCRGGEPGEAAVYRATDQSGDPAGTYTDEDECDYGHDDEI
jgi:hypothetical protein